MEPLTIAVCDVLPEEREKLLKVFRPGIVDLPLKNIYMKGTTGVEAAGKIRELDDLLNLEQKAYHVILSMKDGEIFPFYGKLFPQTRRME